MEIYVTRLFEEWKKYKKIVISVDYDDTISEYRSDFNKKDVLRTIDLVKKASSVGAYIVIFTACNIDRYVSIQEFCEQIQLPIDTINKNPITLPYGNNGKIYYNINLCDRSGLVQALDILESAMYKYIGYLKEQELKNLNEIA